VRPGLTDPASLAYIDEASLLAAAADPEREYIERILPAKVARAAAYAESATLWSDWRAVAHAAHADRRHAARFGPAGFMTPAVTGSVQFQVSTLK
jgi:hypothetical protein